MMKLWQRLSKFIPGKMLDRWSDQLVAKYKKQPPPEVTQTSRFVIAALGEGNNVRSRVVLHGTSPYIVTGFFCAEAARRLLEGKIERYGYVSLAQAFGARSILRSLEDVGTRMTIEAPGHAAR